MSEGQPEVYNASVNPPRRAKRGPLPPTSPEESTRKAPATNSVRQILPTKPYNPRASTTTAEVAVAPPVTPAKRGRKPGPLSRSAREAQRRLNHSIIEKARRTKINDALATLRQLVPVDYGQKSKAAQQDQSSDEEVDDDEYEQGSNKQDKQKPKSGKREEKEKEFKLEILVRTVAFLQDLLKKVEVLEGNTGSSGSGPMLVESSKCQNCVVQKEQKKRKRADTEQWGEREDSDGFSVAPPPEDPSQRPAKVRRNTNIEDLVHQPPTPPSQEPIHTSHVTSLPHTHTRSERISPHLHRHHQVTHGQENGHAEQSRMDSNRLPPIASWLPDVMIDPRLLPPSAPDNIVAAGSYLPSPPSSTHFDPIRSSQIPPVLNLGPTAADRGSRSPPMASNFSSSSSSGRTPEDENAASLLLQMQASPPIFRGGHSGSIKKGGPGTSPYGLTEPSNFVLHSGLSESRRTRMEDERVDNDYHATMSSVRQAQTPGSMLGIQHRREPRGSS